MDILDAIKNPLFSAADAGIIELQRTLGQAKAGKQPATLDTPQTRPEAESITKPQPVPAWYKTPIAMAGIGLAVVVAVLLIKRK